MVLSTRGLNLAANCHGDKNATINENFSVKEVKLAAQKAGFYVNRHVESHRKSLRLSSPF